GRELDVAGSIAAVRAGYLHDKVIRLPVKTSKPRSRNDDVDKALAAARAAVAAPIEVSVDGKPLTVTPADIARGLSYVASDDGSLSAHLNADKVIASLGHRLDAVEQLPVDATFDVSSGSPVLVPSRDGRTVPPASFGDALRGAPDDAAPR